jgi:Flp pilus assembly protein TadB
MENGYVILGIIALLFLSMYGYAYFSVALEKIKAIREKKRNVHKMEQRHQESLKKQELIDEKVRKFNERKEEIQKELMLLEKMKARQKVG